MTGSDEYGNYTVGRIVQISGDAVTYTLSTYPIEYTTVVADVRQFSPGQAVKVYQGNQMVLPL